MNAQEVLNNINTMLAEAEEYNKNNRDGYYRPRKRWYIRSVCRDLGIFDWWDDYLSVSQLKSMKTFIEQGMKRGFCGYVCFKVGVKYCSHGMWIHKNESTDGYSPDGSCLFHSFRSGENYWDMETDNGVWLHEIYPDRGEFTLKDIDAELAEEKKKKNVLSFKIDISVDEDDEDMSEENIAYFLKKISKLMIRRDEKRIQVLECEFNGDVTKKYISEGWCL